MRISGVDRITTETKLQGSVCFHLGFECAGSFSYFALSRRACQLSSLWTILSPSFTAMYTLCHRSKDSRSSSYVFGTCMSSFELSLSQPFGEQSMGHENPVSRAQCVSSEEAKTSISARRSSQNFHVSLRLTLLSFT